MIAKLFFGNPLLAASTEWEICAAQLRNVVPIKLIASRGVVAVDVLREQSSPSAPKA